MDNVFNTDTSGFNFTAEFVETTSETVQVRTRWIKILGECLKREMGKGSKESRSNSFLWLLIGDDDID